jgi:hypothetical protein
MIRVGRKNSLLTATARITVMTMATVAAVVAIMMIMMKMVEGVHAEVAQEKPVMIRILTVKD